MSSHVKDECATMDCDESTAGASGPYCVLDVASPVGNSTDNVKV